METQLEIKVPKTTKKDMVLTHLKKYGWITLFGKMGSQELYHLNALSQRVRQLVRENKIPIQTFTPKGREMAYYIYRGTDTDQNWIELQCQKWIPGYKTK